MSMLDINTPRGQQTLRDEDRAVRLLEQRFPNARYVHTDKRTAAKIDAVLIEGGNQIGGVVLTSCRYNCTPETLHHLWNDEWLLTWRKVALAAWMAKHMQTPLIGLLYFVKADTLLVTKLYEAGRWVAPLRFDRTATQATVNGGVAVRINVFITVRHGVKIVGTSEAA